MVRSGSWASDAAEIDKEAAGNQTAATEMKSHPEFISILAHHK